jgi:PTS system nitrogen regulatory IIA component
MPHSADALTLGATLRLLRVEAGLSLRELAARVGVSTAYLSRVENGHDAAPTPERLTAIARELDLPAPLLVDLAQRVSPYLASYLEAEPEAGALFLEIARRQLDGAALRRLRALLEEAFPLPAARRAPAAPELAPLVAPARVLLQLQCAGLEDALDLCAGRLLSAGEPPGARALAAALRARVEQASPALGHGVAVVHAPLPAGAAPRGALATLAAPLPGVPTPDGAPVRLLVVLAGGERGRPHLLRLAHVARLAARGLAERLAGARTAPAVLERLAQLEALR